MTVRDDGGTVELRPAIDADVETLDEITIATEAVGDAPTAAPGTHVPYLRHLVARGHVVVAVDAEDGAIVGFGASVDTGRARHLADLFVRPGRQGGFHARSARAPRASRDRAGLRKPRCGHRSAPPYAPALPTPPVRSDR